MFKTVLGGLLMAIPLAFVYNVFRKGGSLEKAMEGIENLPPSFIPMLSYVFGPILLWLFWRKMKMDERERQMKVIEEHLELFKAQHEERMRKFHEGKEEEAEITADQSEGDSEDPLLSLAEFFSKGFGKEEEEDSMCMAQVSPPSIPTTLPQKSQR